MPSSTIGAILFYRTYGEHIRVGVGNPGRHAPLRPVGIERALCRSELERPDCGTRFDRQDGTGAVDCGGGPEAPFAGGEAVPDIQITKRGVGGDFRGDR